MDHQTLPSYMDIPPVHVVYAPVFLQQNRTLYVESEEEDNSFQRYWRSYSKHISDLPTGSTLTDTSYWRLPEMMGFSRSRLLRGDLRERGPRETLVLLTDWLYFGMLQCVTRKIFAIDEFLLQLPCQCVPESVNAKTVVLTTRHLPKLLERWWRESLQDRDDGEILLSENRRINKCLADVWYLVTQHRDSFVALCPPLGEHLHLAVSILGELLQEAKERVWDNKKAVQYGMRAIVIESVNPGRDARGEIRWGPSPLLRRRMDRLGWCRTEITRLETIMPVIGMYYASFLFPRRERKPHQNCCDTFCEIGNIDESTYKTKHTSTCQNPGQDWLSPDIESEKDRKIRHIIEADGIPVIKLTTRRTTSLGSQTEGQSSNFDFDIVDATRPFNGERRPRYVAISHVWVDGLGNPTANSLPICQLQRFQKLVNDVLRSGEGVDYELTPWSRVKRLTSELYRSANPPDCLWWIDTICVPRGPGSDDIRQKAMKKMVGVYKDAFKVLVVDEGLLQISIDSPNEELIMRVTCSGWMRRLWTLNEAILANESLFVQCSGGIFNIYRKAVSVRPEHYHVETMSVYNRTSQPVPFPMWALNRLYDFSLYVRNPVECHIRRYWQGVYSIHTATSGSAERFMHVWNEARWRSASHETDRPFVLATLLGIETAANIRLCEDPDQAVGELYRFATSVPANIIFVRGPRLRRSNHMAWAPSKFSRFDRLNVWTDGKGEQVDTEGLSVHLPGLILHEAPTELVLAESTEFYVCKSTTDEFLVVRVIGDKNIKKDKSVAQVLRAGGSHYALILERGSPLELRDNPQSTNAFRRGILACLRGVVPSSENLTRQAIAVDYCCLIEARLITGSSSKRKLSAAWMSSLDAEYTSKEYFAHVQHDLGVFDTNSNSDRVITGVSPPEDEDREEDMTQHTEQSIELQSLTRDDEVLDVTDSIDGSRLDDETMLSESRGYQKWYVG